MSTNHTGSDAKGHKTWSLLGAEITVKDFLQYIVLVVAAIFFVSNMNNRIDNLTQSVERLNDNFIKKDVVDQSQDQKLSVLETGVALINQRLQIITPGR